MRVPLVEGLKSGGWCRDCTHAARRLTRFSGPGHYCSANHPKWSGWQELHLRPPRSERGRLLLTLPPEKWLPDLDSHQDKRLNRPPCYFDTTWQWRCDRIPVWRTGVYLSTLMFGGMEFPGWNRSNVCSFANRRLNCRPTG